MADHMVDHKAADMLASLMNTALVHFLGVHDPMCRWMESKSCYLFCSLKARSWRYNSKQQQSKEEATIPRSQNSQLLLLDG